AGVKAAMMLDMFNAALKTFGNHSLDFQPRIGYVPEMDFNAPRAFYHSYTNLISPFRYLTCTDIFTPELNTYNRSFNPRMIRGGVMMTYSARSMTNGIEVSEDVAEAPESVLMESKVAAAVTVDMAKEEAIEEEADAGNSAEGGNTDNFEYRDSEVPLAFFAPILTTDEQGNLSYSFTVPNANTSWILSAMAYTTDLRTASITRSAIASKPIMVTPNLPRFIRTGDEIFIESQVFNTTENATTAQTEVEILNPSDGEILQSETYTTEIGASGSATVRTKVSAPFDIPFLCFRIKSSTEGFSDGEQALIPILPSSTPVFESSDFYIPADEKKFSLKLPDYGADTQVTLTYCDNPIWYVVTALPGLQQSNPISAVDAARNIFSAAIAKGIIERYPQIGEALEYWLSNPSDSIMTSMLERNSELKTMLLAATPWMQNAQSDTERMTRLALLLNKKECEKTIAEATKFISHLQSTDGGISWMKQYSSPSLWTTTSVLNTLGKLNSLKFMPANDDLTNIINKGLKYIEKEYTSIFSKYPNSDFTTYTETVTRYPEYTPSTIGRSMISTTSQRIIKNWKGMDIEGKANAALLLYRSGNKATAATILKSLDEYATVSPDKGMWWQPVNNRTSALSALSSTASALNAYTTITPGAPQIEKITQWLVLQKQATDWGNTSVAAEIVAAILTSSPEWISESGKVNFKLNGKNLPCESTKYTGETKIRLNPKTASGAHLNIIRNNITPAWGGVISVDTKDMKNVNAASCNQLSITKQFVVAGKSGWEKQDSLKVGDKVKITLIIKSESAIDYLAITDSRAACFEPVEQTPAPIWSDGICFYRENRDSSTNIFVDHLPKGTFVIEYEMWVNNAGEFASGIATAQSQYAPEIAAHSSGKRIISTR
ncbi:MAG: hypothetical protein K2G09_09290, partial [Paramuribaculum sp.]|nr:hypothetical protein [Paramuribaculum sp.]